MFLVHTNMTTAYARVLMSRILLTDHVETAHLQKGLITVTGNTGAGAQSVMSGTTHEEAWNNDPSTPGLSVPCADQDIEQCFQFVDQELDRTEKVLRAVNKSLTGEGQERKVSLETDQGRPEGIATARDGVVDTGDEDNVDEQPKNSAMDQQDGTVQAPGNSANQQAGRRTGKALLIARNGVPGTARNRLKMPKLEVHDVADVDEAIKSRRKREAIDERHQIIVDLLVSRLKEKQSGDQPPYPELNPGLKLSLDSDALEKLVLEDDSLSSQVAGSVRERLGKAKYNGAVLEKDDRDTLTKLSRTMKALDYFKLAISQNTGNLGKALSASGGGNLIIGNNIQPHVRINRKPTEMLLPWPKSREDLNERTRNQKPSTDHKNMIMDTKIESYLLLSYPGSERKLLNNTWRLGGRITNMRKIKTLKRANHTTLATSHNISAELGDAIRSDGDSPMGGHSILTHISMPLAGNSTTDSDTNNDILVTRDKQVIKSPPGGLTQEVVEKRESNLVMTTVVDKNLVPVIDISVEPSKTNTTSDLRVNTKDIIDEIEVPERPVPQSDRLDERATHQRHGQFSGLFKM